MIRRGESELAELMRAANAGDERAYADFLHDVAALLRGFARRKLPLGALDPEDVVQETLLAIHLKRATWQPHRPVLPWVYAIARFKLIDAMRRRGRSAEAGAVGIDDLADFLAAPEVETVSDRDLGRALDALAPGQRAVVVRISIDGLSIAETAEELKMSEPAVRVALHRGLATIARTFARD